MSIIQTGNYTDFKTVVDNIGKFKQVFYFDSGAGLFVIYVVTGESLSISSGNLSSQPGSFTTDFPTAVVLTTTLSLS